MEQCKCIEDKLNARARKTFGFVAPIERYDKLIAAVFTRSTCTAAFASLRPCRCAAPYRGRPLRSEGSSAISTHQRL